MGRKSREKGKRGERELVDILKEFGFAQAVRNWAPQSMPGGSGIDVQAHTKTGRIYLQSKFGKVFNATKALAEVQKDVPVGVYAHVGAAHRKVPSATGHALGWVVTVPLREWLMLIKQAEAE